MFASGFEVWLRANQNEVLLHSPTNAETDETGGEREGYLGPWGLSQRKTLHGCQYQTLWRQREIITYDQIGHI